MCLKSNVLVSFLAPVLGVSKTMLRFNDVAERLHRLRKAALFTVATRYSERGEVKISKDKGAEAGAQTDQTRASSCPLPAEMHRQRFVLPETKCDNTQSTANQGGSAELLSCRGTA